MRIIEEINVVLNAARSETIAKRMEMYVRNLFSYYGIQAVKRREICKPFLNQLKFKKTIDWSLVDACFQEEKRELQYFALDYLQAMKKHLVISDLNYLRNLVLTKSWWDTVDIINNLIGLLVKNNPALKQTMLTWATDDNIWIRRVAIDHQLLFRNETDTDLMSRIISLNFGSKEFFINKAIGWTLREYKKTNQEWVLNFLAENKENLHPLSVREALRVRNK